MFKALIAATAITVCCLGNDYPAKAEWDGGDHYWPTHNYNLSPEENRLRNLEGRIRHQERIRNCFPDFYCN
jgi:hypothetical protein